LTIRTIILAIACAMPMQAGANDLTKRITVTMTVPYACSAETVAMTRTETGLSLIINEECNSGRGYDVFLQHTAGSIAELRYDNRPLTPSPSGNTLLSRSNRAQDRQARVDIVGAHDTQAFITIMPRT